MKTTQSKDSPAFTLVELLVVITIIGVLISLLLPAVQAAREAARQTQCRNNMKQLGLAAMNYENQHWYFPPSSNCIEGTSPGSLRIHYRNWTVALLPFLEQQALYDAFDLSRPINDPANRIARGTELQVMKCPTDMGHAVKFASTNSAEGDNWARGNYAANASLGSYGYSSTSGHAAAGKTSVMSLDRWHRGIMGCNLSMGVSEVYDGASNTILLAEIRVGVVKEDRRGTWALDHPGASSLWAHGFGDDNGPNQCNDWSDDLMDCDALMTSAGGIATLRATCMTCCQTCTASSQAGPRSRHRGGIHATMADGSVRFISDYIEKGSGAIGGWYNNPANTPNPATEFLCWQRLCCSQDGQVVDGKKF